MFVEFAIATSTFAAIIAENIQKAITQDPQSFGLSPRSWEGVPDGGLPLVPPFDLILTDPIARVFLRSRVVQQMPMMMGGRPPPPQLRSDLMGDDTSTAYCFTSISVDVEGDPGSPNSSGIRFSRWQYETPDAPPSGPMRVNFDGTASVFVGLRRESTDGPEQTPEVVRRSITIDHSVRIRVPIRLTAVTLRDLRLLSGDPIALRAASAELWIEALISLTYDRFDADNPVLLSLIDIYPKVNVPGTRSTCP